MKRLLFILFLGIWGQGVGQVDTLNPLTSKEIADSMYGQLDEFIQNGKLYNRLLLESTTQSICWNIDSIGKSPTTNFATADYVYGVLYEAKTMSIDTSTVPSLMQVFDPAYAYVGESEFEYDDYYYPMGIVDYDYSYIDIEKNKSIQKIKEDNYVINVLSSPVIETKRVSIVGPLFDYHDGERMGIVFKRENFYSNRKTVDEVASISVTNQTQTVKLKWDELFYFTPVQDSIQLFQVTIDYNDRSSITNYFVINTPELVLKSDEVAKWNPGCTDLLLGGSKIINHNGNKLKWCWIPRCGSDGRLFKPYILLTGYRPPIIGQSFKKTWKIYNNNHGSLLTSLVDNNYDILLVKFNIHAKPYSHGMEESADLLMEFLEKVNVAKGGQLSGQENTIQGSSMSADIARLALLRMEKKHMEDNSYPHHHTRLFIAYDGNFYGANLPMAYQNQVYSHFKYPAAIPWPGGLAYQGLKYLLSTYLFATMQQKTVKELLMYHATAYDDNLFSSPYYHTSYTPKHHWRRQGYYNAVNAVDNGVHIFPMPIACRNVAISLGKISETNNENETDHVHFNGAGQYWRDVDLGLWKFKLRASKYIANEYTELFWRKKIGLSWNSLYVNHRVHVKAMQEIDMASGSYLDGTGNLISVGNWTYFTLLNIFDGRDHFSHKAVVTALGINKELWPDNGSMTLNMKTLGLMYNTLNFNPNNPSDYFGYPNLGRPTDHFYVTPFEAIYVDNRINPHIKPNENVDNDADLSQLNNFIRNEVEPWYLGLQNTNLGSKARSNYIYRSYRRAKHLIVVGKLVTPTTDPGDYVVEQNGNLTLKSAEISLKPGVHFKNGSYVHIVPEYEACSNEKSISSHSEETTQNDDVTGDFQSSTLSLKENISVYPNPSTTNVIIESMDRTEIFEVAVFDLTGVCLQRIFDSNSKLELSTAALASGNYFLQIKTANGQITKPLIKQ